MDVRNKTVVVTGAGRGIGRAIALQLAACGADIAVFDLNAHEVDETTALCTALSVHARGYRVNVAEEGEVCAAMIQVAKDKALKGDQRAAQTLINLMRELDILKPQEAFEPRIFTLNIGRPGDKIKE